MGNPVYRQTLITRLQNWFEGKGAPTYDGKSLPLSHLKVICDDGGKEREVTHVDWTSDTRAPQTADSIIDMANEHACDYQTSGFAPRYWLRVFFGGKPHHTHEVPVQTDPVQRENESGYLPAGPVDAGQDNRRRGREFETLLQVVKIAVDNSQHDRNQLATAWDRINERLYQENRELRGEFGTMRKELNAALDQSLDREIRRDKAHLLLKVQAAVAEQGIAALPAFMGFGHRMLNAKLGVKEDAPMAVEVEAIIDRLSTLEPDKLKTALDAMCTSDDEKQHALLLIQRHRGKKNAKDLDRKALAAADGVTRPMPLARFIDLANKTQSKPASGASEKQEVKRPSPFHRTG